jgi:hypothetical protein
MVELSRIGLPQVYPRVYPVFLNRSQRRLGGGGSVKIVQLKVRIALETTVGI